MPDNISEDTRNRIAEKMGQMKEQKANEAFQHIIEFNRTPVDLKSHMDQYVIGQEKGKRIMSTAISFHYRRLGSALKQAMVEFEGDIGMALKNAKTPKANILIIGPTGCGKTYTSETASSLVGVPYVEEDLTKFSETGYVGQSATDILVDLLVSADGNSHIAQMGVVYLDEIDKIAMEQAVYKDVSGKGVQKGLLKLVEGVENSITIEGERILLSTRHVLFIAGGAFEKLEEIVRSCMKSKNLTGDWRDYLLTDDLVGYGMERQLMGRFPVRVAYDSLSVDDLKAIMLRSEGSPLKAYRNDFAAWDIDLKVTDDALAEVAKNAEKEGTGARGLVGILHRVLLDDMYNLPGSHKGELVVNESYVREKLR